MRLLILTLLSFLGISFLVSSQTLPWTGPATNMVLGKLQVSSSGRYLEHSKNKAPFFYLGDTAWELFHRLTEDEVEFYLENRRAKGFTVIQAVILAELDGLQVPNRYGDLPLSDIHEIRPNEAYFKWVDKVIKMAESKGLYIGLLPTWGDKVDKQWGVGPEIFTPAYARAYGEWLGSRYKNFKNIIWINGGDRWGGDGNYPVWDSLAKGIKSKDKNHLMTFHPLGEASSAQWYHNSEWLDFNMLQTGHCQRDYEIYDKLLIKDYNRFPVKPVLDGEPRYENHPVCWKPDELGWFDDADVRQAIYWSLFSGAFGHTYGCHDIWQMLSPGQEPAGMARGNWKTSLDLPGAGQLIHARRLLERVEWTQCEPALELILSDNSKAENKVVALKREGLALVYFPNGEPAEIDAKQITKKGILSLEWMNPGDGSYTEPVEVSFISSVVLTPPASGKGNDWVAILRE